MASPDVIQRLRDLANELRDVELAIENDEEKLKRDKAERHAIVTQRLVDVMNQLGVDTFGIEEDGNQPGLDLEMGFKYTGNIAASWSEEKREAAFAVVPADLIQYSVTIHFTRHQHDRAQRVAEKLIKQGETVSVSKNVNASTLKAWIRETHESGGELPDLELLGGGIFQEVKVKMRRPRR
jgi:hypothetical protein